MSKKITLRGVVVEMRRVYDTLRAGYAGEIPVTRTHGWMVKVVLTSLNGALHSDAIEIPVDDDDGIGLRSVVDLEMMIHDEPR